jgi:beta-lactamase regulating signal transducer with metallopeptidase domain
MIEPIGPWLLNNLLAFTVLVGIATLIDFLPLRMTAAHRSWMWRAVYFKTLIWMLCPSWVLAPLDATLRSCVPVSPAQAASEWLLARPSPSTSPSDANRSSNRQAAGSHREPSPTRSDFDASTTESLTSRHSTPQIHRATGYWVYLWVSVMGLLGCLMIVRTWCMHRLLVRSTRLVPPRLLAMAATTARQMGVRKPSRVELSPEIHGPMLIMSHRVHLVLPEDFESKFGPEACRMAIAHELAHYKRRDLWWNLLPTAVSVLFFFWPPAWWAARRYYLAMEMACDHCAIRYAKLGWVAYAELLVRLLEDKQRRPVGAVALSMARSGSFRVLSERIRFMKVDLQFTRYRNPLSRAILGAAVVLISLPWAMAEDGSKKKKTRANQAQNQTQSSQKESSNTESSSSPYEEPPRAPARANVVSGFASGSASGFGASSGGGAGGGGSGTQGGSTGNGSNRGWGGGNATASGGGSVSAGVSIGPAHQPPQPKSSGERADRGGFGSNNIPLFGGTTGGSPSSSSSASSSSPASGSTSASNSSTSIERSREIRDGVMVSKTRVQLDDVTATIEETDSHGIVVTVRELVRGKDKTKKYKAKDVDALARKHPAAMEWVRKYHTDSHPETPVLDPSGDASQNAFRTGNVGSKFGSTFESNSNSKRFGSSSSQSSSGFGGSFGFGGTSGSGGGSFGGQSGASIGGGGQANGPNPATELMLQQLEKTWNETDNAVLREHIRTMIEQVRPSNR